jgi:DNA adenine methylase
MKMLGSKRTIAKQIMGVIAAQTEPNSLYIEPFVGGANTLPYVPFKSVILSDAHPHLIALLRHVRVGGYLPHTVTEQKYTHAKDNPTHYEDFYVGFVGFCCSFGGKFFGGYARDHKTGRNYADEGRRNLAKLTKHLEGKTLITGSYDMYRPEFVRGAVFYCDPPYQGTTGYKRFEGGKLVSMEFDSAAFWRWAQEMSEHNQVYVSEYSAPEGWEAVWQNTKTVNIDNKGSKARSSVEKLFVYKGD